MSVVDEMAAARANRPQPTDEELELGARWAVAHPDVSPDFKRIVGALLRLLDTERTRD